MSSSGPSKTSGQIDSTVGTAKEAAGNVVGSSDLQQSGKEQHTKGETETKAAEAKGWVEGLVDRVTGTKDSVVGAVTGDKAQQTSGNAQQSKGEVKQNLNK